MLDKCSYTMSLWVLEDEKEFDLTWEGEKYWRGAGEWILEQRSSLHSQVHTFFWEFRLSPKEGVFLRPAGLCLQFALVCQHVKIKCSYHFIFTFLLILTVLCQPDLRSSSQSPHCFFISSRFLHSLLLPAWSLEITVIPNTVLGPQAAGEVRKCS
jgi:hypothetical protein